MATTKLTSASLCPQCGGGLKCFVRDVGGVSYYDEYSLTCEKCGLVGQEGFYGGHILSSDWHTNCPFCGKQETEHETTPERFWYYVKSD